MNFSKGCINVNWPVFQIDLRLQHQIIGKFHQSSPSNSHIQGMSITILTINVPSLSECKDEKSLPDHAFNDSIRALLVANTMSLPKALSYQARLEF